MSETHKQGQGEAKTEPRKEYGTRASNGDKQWLLKQQIHNDWNFQTYPDGQDFDEATFQDAYGIWTTSYQKPLIFGHPTFQIDFECHIEEEIFLFRVGRWDLTLAGPPRQRWTDERQKAWDHLLSSKDKKRHKGYGAKEIFAEFHEILEKK